MRKQEIGSSSFSISCRNFFFVQFDFSLEFQIDHQKKNGYIKHSHIKNYLIQYCHVSSGSFENPKIRERKNPNVCFLSCINHYNLIFIFFHFATFDLKQARHAKFELTFCMIMAVGIYSVTFDFDTFKTKKCHFQIFSK